MNTVSVRQSVGTFVTMWQRSRIQVGLLQTHLYLVLCLEIQLSDLWRSQGLRSLGRLVSVRFSMVQNSGWYKCLTSYCCGRCFLSVQSVYFLPRKYWLLSCIYLLLSVSLAYVPRVCITDWTVWLLSVSAAVQHQAHPREIPNTIIKYCPQ